MQNPQGQNLSQQLDERAALEKKKQQEEEEQAAKLSGEEGLKKAEETEKQEEEEAKKKELRGPKTALSKSFFKGLEGKEDKHIQKQFKSAFKGNLKQLDWNEEEQAWKGEKINIKKTGDKFDIQTSKDFNGIVAFKRDDTKDEYDIFEFENGKLVGKSVDPNKESQYIISKKDVEEEKEKDEPEVLIAQDAHLEKGVDDSKVQKAFKNRFKNNLKPLEWNEKEGTWKGKNITIKKGKDGLPDIQPDGNFSGIVAFKREGKEEYDLLEFKNGELVDAHLGPGDRLNKYKVSGKTLGELKDAREDKLRKTGKNPETYSVEAADGIIKSLVTEDNTSRAFTPPTGPSPSETPVHSQARQQGIGGK